MTDRTNGVLDRAIITYRENPTEANLAALRAAQSAHVEDFYAEQASDYTRRCTEGKR
jgi:hypothetical protein